MTTFTGGGIAHPAPGLAVPPPPAGGFSGGHPAPGLAPDGQGGVVGYTNGKLNVAAPSLAEQSSGVRRTGTSPFRVQVKWLSFWTAEVKVSGTGSVTVTLTGDDTEIVVPLEIPLPAVGRTVRVAFGEGGRCAVVGVLGG